MVCILYLHLQSNLQCLNHELMCILAKMTDKMLIWIWRDGSELARNVHEIVYIYTVYVDVCALGCPYTLHWIFDQAQWRCTQLCWASLHIYIVLVMGARIKVVPVFCHMYKTLYTNCITYMQCNSMRRFCRLNICAFPFANFWMMICCKLSLECVDPLHWRQTTFGSTFTNVKHLLMIISIVASWAQLIK